jgi:hypothetical protein
LYWNVTGNGWAFPIEHASACVKLPKGATVRSIDAYTGPAGEKGNNFVVSKKSSCDVFMETTATLLPREGFTIAVTWPRPSWHGRTQPVQGATGKEGPARYPCNAGWDQARSDTCICT